MCILSSGDLPFILVLAFANQYWYQTSSYVYLLNYMILYAFTVSARTIERKLRSTKVRLFTVPCCSIILFSSEGMKKIVSEFTPNLFRRSIILVGALLFL